MADDTVTGIEVFRGRVLPEWIDVNGHMNVAYYVLAFDYGVDSLWHMFGITTNYVEEEEQSTFAVESHVTYKRELIADDPIVITAQILAYDEKRIHQFQRMYHGEKGFLAATGEWLNLHVDLATRRVTPWPDRILDGIRAVVLSQGDLPYPAEAGRCIRVPRPLDSSEAVAP